MCFDAEDLHDGRQNSIIAYSPDKPITNPQQSLKIHSYLLKVELTFC